MENGLEKEVLEFVESMANHVDYCEDPEECWESMQERAIEFIEEAGAGAYFTKATDEYNEKIIKMIRGM